MHKLSQHSGLRACAPWLGLLLLNALFVAPGVALHLGARPYLLLQPSGDLFVLLLAYVAAGRWTHGAWVRRLAVFTGVVLWLFMVDALVVSFIFRQTPPLYDQTYLLRHLGVLALDLWSWKVGLALAGLSAGIGLGVVLSRMLFRKTTDALARRPLAQTLPVATALGLLIAVGTAVGPNGKRHRGPKAIRWTTPDLVENIRASVRMYRALQRGIEDSPYKGYADRYVLERKPDVQLFLVESYGRILIADPDEGPKWEAHIRDIEARLKAAGWHAASGFSQAPVSGGRSWLAEATLLTGLWVQYEAVFQQMVANMDKTPNLVAFLDAQGYETVLLAPKDRPRPGIEMVNRYDYDRQILALDLEYSGPTYGWGIIPDQYSLGFAQDQVFATIEEPLFTNFHMVSSHAPWRVVPAMVDDWRTLSDGHVPGDTRRRRQMTPEREIYEQARQYRRAWTRNAYMGDADSLTMEAFAATIHYDLELLADHLEPLRGDKLVILMGDHQPPLLSTEDSSYDVPIHVLARDPALLEEFLGIGFTEGLVLSPTEQTAVGHEGMFSLVVRALVRCCGTSDAGPPEYLPDGVRPDTGQASKR